MPLTAAMASAARPPVLNDAQRAVVEHRGGPLLVIAGAGSGKTLTLAARVADLVAEGANPQRLLLLSFSRRAAAELERRSALLAQQRLRAPAGADVRLAWSGTFHSVAARLLRMHAPDIGLPPDFDILDRGDAEELMGQVRQQMQLHRHEQRFPTAAGCAAMHSRSVNADVPLPALLDQAFPWCAAWHDELQALFTAYAQAKRQQHLLDLDDLLLGWQRLMTRPATAAAVRSRFDQVLVDEYQDTNRLQAGIVHALVPDGRGLVVVGDDAQAIYAFRGASVRGILGFATQFDPPARRLTLNQNHRSTPQILAVANAVMADAAQGYGKQLISQRPDALRPRLVTVLDEAAQARWVADEVLRSREKQLALKRQAVLFRTSHHSAALELELARRHIPFVKYGGLRFFESAHVKDLLAVLRWARTPRARLPGQRVLRLVPGIGPGHATRVLDALDVAADPWEALRALAPPPRAQEAWQALLQLLHALRAPRDDWPQALGEARAWYLPHLRRLHDDAATREADLLQLQRVAGGFASCRHFLGELAIDPPAASSDLAADPHLDDDYLILSTIHSAKGQEWNAVTLLNVVDGCMPADMASGSVDEIEEERRLLYVAMTRARDELNLMLPQRFHVSQQRRFGDRHLYAAPSRFLGAAVQALCDAVAAPDVDEPGDPAADLAPASTGPAHDGHRELQQQLDDGLAWSRGMAIAIGQRAPRLRSPAWSALADATHALTAALEALAAERAATIKPQPGASSDADD